MYGKNAKCSHTCSVAPLGECLPSFIGCHSRRRFVMILTIWWRKCHNFCSYFLNDLNDLDISRLQVSNNDSNCSLHFRIDAVHPNEAGYQRLREVLNVAITNLLRPQNTPRFVKILHLDHYFRSSLRHDLMKRSGCPSVRLLTILFFLSPLLCGRFSWSFAEWYWTLLRRVAQSLFLRFPPRERCWSALLKSSISISSIIT